MLKQFDAAKIGEKNKLTFYISLLPHVILMSILALIFSEIKNNNFSINIFLFKLLPYISISIICLALSALIKKKGQLIIKFWIISTVTIPAYIFLDKDITPNSLSNHEPTVVAQTDTSSNDKIKNLTEDYFSAMGRMPEWRGYNENERYQRAMEAASIKLGQDEMRAGDWYLYTYIRENITKGTDIKISDPELLAQIRHYPLNYLSSINDNISKNLFNGKVDEKVQLLSMQIMTDVMVNKIPIN
ncbi:hypothetical protein [Pectobacterium carotovorum]|uniref:hypothetical protein n=1 Tax=Pectobacterium carotovorum TaxID=554 RepID=UPI00208A1495|nr:hypothetical protein [Pectobacterium carotovorum]GKV88487.1 hypothetical protein PEC301619_04690 [Pectobacterium carotovorum subsp. carotovorum]